MTDNIVIDVHGRFWQYVTFIDAYQCITVPALSPQTLEALDKVAGPLHIAKPGEEIKVKPIHPPGTVVKFDFPTLTSGTVVSSKRTNTGKIVYTLEVEIAEEWIQ